MKRSAVAVVLVGLGLSGGAGSVHTSAPVTAPRAQSRLVAELNAAIQRFERGDRDEAMRGFRRLVAAYNESDTLTSEELVAVAMACKYLGADDPQFFKDALRAFDEAIARDPANTDARVRLAELFLEKYNSEDAAKALEEAERRDPENPRVLLALARVKDFDGEPGVLDLVARALARDPDHVEARVFQGELLLEQEDFEGAARQAEAILARHPASLPAMSVLAAARYLQGDTARYEETRKRALRENPRAVEMYIRLAEQSARNRLYADAVAFAQQAVALDARSWKGLGVLGLNQLRTGAMDEARRNLDASFKGDPYNVWIKNTLDLLDTLPKYQETVTPHFRLIVHGKESELLAPYVGELAEEAYERLAERYRYRPPAPVRLEVYPSHGDFSVRTVGLAGLGALGVSFGPVLAIDSPSARETGQFNWGSTLWHEVAHSVTTGATDSRIPRWFGEGLSVREERRARRGWGDDVTLEFLRALQGGKLLPLATLNNGFARPTGPEQVPISYYQASLLVEWIEAERGFPAILELLAAYRAGSTTAAAFSKVLGKTLEEVDREFFAHLRTRFSGALANLGEFEAQMAAGVALFQQKKLAEALPLFERARAAFPEYGGTGSPYPFLAHIYKEQGATDKAREALADLTAINESDYKAHVELAAMREAQGDVKGAAAALDQAVYIWPFEPGLHERLAALNAKLGDRARVVRARRSLVALDPVDKPEALYQLALALVDAGETAKARREVLRALELAPRFQRAQELLLRLHADTGAGGGA
jgi:tetratricopeptide (TPR) repeat protein